MNLNNPKPTLIEPGMKYVINTTLNQCHLFRVKYHNFFINIGLFILFVIILGALLIYKYKGKMSDEEKELRERQKEEYIMKQIVNYKASKERTQQSIITGLPEW